MTNLPRRGPAAAFLALLLVFPAGPALAGLYFESTTTDQPERGKANQILVHSWIDGDFAKVLFIDGDEGLMKDGSYLLTRDGGATLHLVNPKDKNYMVWDLDAMFAGLAAMMQSAGPLFNLDFSNPSFEKLGDESGGELLGRSTRKHSYRSKFDMTVKIVGIKRESHVESMQEVWVAYDLSDPGLGIWLRQKPPSTGDPEFDKLLLAGWEAMEGFPLKSVTRSVTTSKKKGKTNTTVSTMVVTVLREETPPAGTFDIPGDYTLISMPTLGSPDSTEKSDEDGGGRFSRFRRKKKDD